MTGVQSDDADFGTTIRESVDPDPSIVRDKNSTKSLCFIENFRVGPTMPSFFNNIHDIKSKLSQIRYDAGIDVLVREQWKLPEAHAGTASRTA